MKKKGLAAAAPKAAPKSAPQAIQLVLPDTGPLISLAMGDALELLLLAAQDVRLIVTDIVAFEATQRADELPDAARIRDFLQRHAARIEIMPTTVGQLALGDQQRRSAAGQSAQSLPKDLGELSITNVVISLRSTNPGAPTLVLIEDDWFAANAYALPGNVHVLSTSAWLDGLEQLGAIASASEIRQRIALARPNFRADFVVDRPASKMEGGTVWKEKFRKRRG